MSILILTMLCGITAATSFVDFTSKSLKRGKIPAIPFNQFMTDDFQ